MVSSSTDGQLILQAMRAGAKEFLTQPVGIEELVLALERIGADRGGGAAGQVRSCQMLAVAGATGGVGSTSLAVNLGCVLAANEANSVALVDLDLSLGDADVFLDTIPDYTMVDVVAEYRPARFPAAQAIDDQARIRAVSAAASGATAGHFADHARRAATRLRAAQSHLLARADRSVQGLQSRRHDRPGSGPSESCWSLSWTCPACGTSCG